MTIDSNGNNISNLVSFCGKIIIASVVLIYAMGI